MDKLSSCCSISCFLFLATVLSKNSSTTTGKKKKGGDNYFDSNELLQDLNKAVDEARKVKAVEWLKEERQNAIDNGDDPGFIDARLADLESFVKEYSEDLDKLLKEDDGVGDDMDVDKQSKKRSATERDDDGTNDVVLDVEY